MSDVRRATLRWAPMLGFMLVLPGVLFVTANLLKYELGLPFLYEVLRPVVQRPSTPALEGLQAAAVVLGPLAALILSGLTVLRLRVRREDRTLISTMSVRLSWPHLAVAALSLAVLGSVALYLVAENL